MIQPSVDLQVSCVYGFIYTNAQANVSVTPDDAMLFCAEQLGAYGLGLANEIAGMFGGPGIILGTAIPLLVVSIFISLARVKKIRNPRSITLLIASLGNVVLLISIACAMRNAQSAGRGTDLAGFVGVDILVVFLAAAGSTRFVQVLGNPDRRILLQRIMSAGLFIYGIILMVMGYREINATKTYPTDFSYAIVVLLYGPIIYYFLGGVFCFSWNLPTFKPTQVVQERDPFATLKTVRLINDVSMGLILLLCIAELAIIIPLKASPYNNQCACLFGTSILFIENTFETATNSMRGKNPFSGSSHRPGNNQSTSFLGSKTGGKSANVSVRAGLNRHNNVPPPLDPLSGKPVLAHPAHMGPTSTYASGEADVEADHTQSIT